MWKRLTLLVAPLLAAPLLVACAPTGSSEVQVVAGFYPLQYVAQRIAGTRAVVTNLTQPGVEPHDVELSPRQVARVSGADVVIAMRGFQPALDQAIANAGGDGVLVDPAAKGFPTSGPSRLRSDNPHFWQDPWLVADLGDAVAKALGSRDPGHRQDYLARAADLRTDLTGLDREYTRGLAHCARTTVVVSHDAFGYLERYGLRFEPIAGLSPDAEPSARHLAQLSDLIRSDGITTVFTERLASPKLADTLAGDLGVRTAVLDPIEGLTSQDSKESYLSLMRSNLAALQKAGGCS